MLLVYYSSPVLKLINHCYFLTEGKTQEVSEFFYMHVQLVGEHPSGAWPFTGGQFIPYMLFDYVIHWMLDVDDKPKATLI